MRLDPTHIQLVPSRLVAAKRKKKEDSPRVLILLAKTTYRANAFVEASRKLGLEISVGSNHQQSLSGLVPGSSLLLKPNNVEVSVEDIVRFHSSFPLDAIVAAEDAFCILASAAAETIGLVHHSLEGVSAVRNKRTMREKLAGEEGRAIWFDAFDLSEDVKSIVGKVPFPCVVKPVSLSGSRGVMRCNNQEEFVAAWDRLGKLLMGDPGNKSDVFSGEILVEDYLDGKEIAVEGIMVQGSLHLIGIMDKPDWMDGPFFEETILITPSRLPTKVLRDLVSRTEQIATILGLMDGPIHAKFRIKKEEISLLEIAPRSIGGYCSRIFKFYPESTLEELILRHSLGMKINHFEKENKSEGVFMLPVPKAGILKNVGRIEEALKIDGIEDIEMTIPVGRKVVPLPEGNQYLGFIFAKGKDPSSVESSLREAFSILELEIQ